MNPILARLTAADRKPLPQRLDDAATDADRVVIFLAAYDGAPPAIALDFASAAYGTADAGPDGRGGTCWQITMFGITGTGPTFDAAAADWTATAIAQTIAAARARLADPPGDDDTTLLAAARALFHLSPDPRERAEAGELMTWLTHTPHAEDAA